MANATTQQTQTRQSADQLRKAYESLAKQVTDAASRIERREAELAAQVRSQAEAEVLAQLKLADKSLAAMIARKGEAFREWQNALS